MAPHDLAGLLSPFDVATFLRTCWGQQYLHVPGSPDKFSELLPWPALNRILEQHRLDHPRLRLMREGQPVPAASYVTQHSNRKRPNQPIARVRAADLSRELRNGATLVLDAVDELHPPITDIAESLERVFRVRIQVNSYAGWRTSHGFDLHWDDHDVFILQVAGRKEWKIYGMTRKYPLAVDVEPAVEKPSIPIWEGMLNQGDLLYIPRGWWHVATPLDEPTLHLTVGVNNPSGADLLTWFVNRLRAHEDVRRDLPQFAAAQEQIAYAERLGNLLRSEWRPELMTEYLADSDSRSQPRAKLSLPWAATPDVLPPDTEDFRIRWSAARQPGIERCDGEVHVSANGRRWRFAAAAAPLLDKLATGGTFHLSDLANDGVPESILRLFVQELATNGLVVVV